MGTVYSTVRNSLSTEIRQVTRIPQTRMPQTLSKKKTIQRAIINYMKENEETLSNFTKGNCLGMSTADMYLLRDIRQFIDTYCDYNSFKAAVRCFAQDIGYRDYSLHLKKSTREHASTPQPCYRRQVYRVKDDIQLINISRSRWVLIDNFSLLRQRIIRNS